jgi:hypothetical protein
VTLIAMTQSPLTMSPKKSAYGMNSAIPSTRAIHASTGCTLRTSSAPAAASISTPMPELKMIQESASRTFSDCTAPAVMPSWLAASTTAKWMNAVTSHAAPATALPATRPTCQSGRRPPSAGQSAEARLTPKITRNGAAAAMNNAATMLRH